jgi:DNA-binding response OmpR family regulator
VERPDVILDLGLPDLDGVEVTGAFENGRPVPVIIPGSDQESDKIAALTPAQMIT